MYNLPIYNSESNKLTVQDTNWDFKLKFFKFNGIDKIDFTQNWLSSTNFGALNKKPKLDIKLLVK